MPSPRPGLSTRLTENVVLRAATYYAVLVAAFAIATRWWPDLLAASPRFTDTAGGSGSGLRSAAVAQAAAAPHPATLALTVALAMGSAVLLALPVAWVYRLTRSKRGYQQSVVQTLVILPMVVAGVVVLVKDSLALAFGLAGIVAAVRFRTTLDDSKDAMYVFLATGIGLAAAVDLPVAAVLSLVFNCVILLLWVTDFGHQPAHLEGRTADRRLQQALDHLSRTGTFVAKVDDTVLRDMSAEQLRALMERAARRARRNVPEADRGDARPALQLRLAAPDGAAARPAIEAVLRTAAKTWTYRGIRQDDDGGAVLEYAVTLRKRVEREALLESLRAAGAVHVDEVELSGAGEP